MKKIIISLSIIAVVAVLGIGITTAYFSDTETSEDNTMAAGTMDLNIDNGNVAVKTMSLTNKAPGDVGTEIAILKNVGSLDGILDIKVENVMNYPCTNDLYGANDSTQYCNDDAGTLGAYVEMALYIDVDEGGTWTSGDIQLTPGDTLANENSGSETLSYNTIDSYNNMFWNNIYAGLMGLDAEDDFVIDWKISTTATNGIQGDAVEFDVTFTLRQASAPNSN